MARKDKAAERDYQREHYIKNKDRYKERTSKNRKTYENRNKEYVIGYLLNHPCVDCGNNDIRVLEFDHVCPTTKLKSVSDLMGESNIQKLISEIEKCVVRCANCHKIRTSKQFNWYKDVWQNGYALDS